MYNNDVDIYNGYMARKNGGGSNFNFELEPLIKDFSFFDFFHDGSVMDIEDFGAFAVLTTKQYVIGYNAGFGSGSHYASYARVLKDISGGGMITNQGDLSYLSFKCMANYITLRICCEKINGKSTGCITINIPKNGITQEQFDVFEKFYADYNGEIEKVCNRYGCRVSFGKYETPGRIFLSNNLDEIREYLLSIINPEKKIEENFEEVIIGTPLRGTKKKK